MIRILTLVTLAVLLMAASAIWFLLAWWQPVQGWVEPWLATAGSILTALGAWTCCWLLKHPKEA